MNVNECKVWSVDEDEGFGLEEWLTEAMKEKVMPLVVLGFFSSDRYVMRVLLVYIFIILCIMHIYFSLPLNFVPTYL